jgi:alpha-L-rhamnosidase
MEGGPAWSDAMVICPIEIQHAYDDKRLLERLLPAMTNFVRYLERSCGPGLAAPEKFPCYGDWLSINADTPKPLIYQAYFAQSAKLVAQACDTLGRKEEAESFRDLARRAREAFVRDRVKPDGRIDGDTQTAYVLAIMFDLVEGDAFRKAGEYLAANVEKRGTLSTGFVGTKDLMPALTKSGRSDLAYRLLESELFPGWGFSVKHGATTIWERWNGWTPDGGPHPDRMNSYSHYSFGAVYQWMVENIGGLRAIEPGWNTFEVAPAPGGTLSNAAVKVGTVHGDITSSWRRGGAVSTFEVTVPVGTVAKVRLPVREGLALSEGTAPAAVGNGIRSLKREPTQVLMELGSGTYKFEAK